MLGYRQNIGKLEGFVCEKEERRGERVGKGKERRGKEKKENLGERKTRK